MNGAKYSSSVLDRTLAEHAIGLIDHEMAQLRVEHVARVLELLQAARSGDDQIDAGLERVGLQTLAASADDAAHSQLGMLGDQLAHFLRTPARSTTLSRLAGSRVGATNRDLQRQLTARHEDDCSRSIGSRYERRIARLVLLELLHQWQHIRQGLAATRGSGEQQAAALHHGSEGTSLDGGRCR